MIEKDGEKSKKKLQREKERSDAAKELRDFQDREKERINKEAEARHKLKAKAKNPIMAVSSAGIEQVLIRTDRVEQKKKEGFRVVGTGKDSRGKILGVRTHADDLVLMEK